MSLLVGFVARLAGGLAAALAGASTRDIRPGYFQVHSYVVLGLGALAAAVAWLVGPATAFWPAVTVVASGYVASILFAYGLMRSGKLALGLAVAASVAIATVAFPAQEGLSTGNIPIWAAALDAATAGAVLGTALAAMLLGHWYLNSPGMKLRPLRALILACAAALAVRAAWCAVAWWLWAPASPPAGGTAALLGLRYLAGLAAPVPLLWMTWQTLKIPNTQSATGILYVVVIVTFIGELSAVLLAAQLGLPV